MVVNWPAWCGHKPACMLLLLLLHLHSFARELSKQWQSACIGPWQWTQYMRTHMDKCLRLRLNCLARMGEGTLNIQSTESWQSNLRIVRIIKNYLKKKSKWITHTLMCLESILLNFMELKQDAFSHPKQSDISMHLTKAKVLRLLSNLLCQRWVYVLWQTFVAKSSCVNLLWTDRSTGFLIH